MCCRGIKAKRKFNSAVEGEDAFLRGEDPSWPEDVAVVAPAVKSVVVDMGSSCDLKGTYVEKGETKYTTYELRFTANGTVQGHALDEDGKATVDGKYNASTGRFSWKESGNGFVTAVQLSAETSAGQDGRLQGMIGAYVSNTGLYGSVRVSPTTANAQPPSHHTVAIGTPVDEEKSPILSLPGYTA